MRLSTTSFLKEGEELSDHVIMISNKVSLKLRYIVKNMNIFHKLWSRTSFIILVLLILVGIFSILLVSKNPKLSLSTSDAAVLRSPKDGSGPVVATVNVKDFGAKCDAGTDDTLAIQKAINTLVTTGGTISFPAGTCRITNTLNINEGKIALRGQGQHITQIHLDNANARIINIEGGNTGISAVYLKDMSFIAFDASNNTRTAGNGIYLHNVGDWSITNVSLTSCWDCIYLNSAHTGLIENVVISDYTAVIGGGLNTGITLINSISNSIKNVNVTSSNSILGGYIVDGGTDTLVIEKSGVQYVGSGGATYGVLFKNTTSSHDPRWIRITNSFFEPKQDTGVSIMITAGYDIETAGLYTKGGQYGVYITGPRVREVRFRDGIIQLAEKDGVVLENFARDVSFNGTLVTDNSQSSRGAYDGIVVAPGMTNFSFDNVRSGNTLWNGTDGFGANQRYGINIQPGGNNYRVTKNDLTNNITGGLYDPGGTSEVRFGNLGTSLPDLQ